MLSGLLTPSKEGIIHAIGRIAIAGVTAVGDLSLFSLRMVRWIFRAGNGRRCLWPTCTRSA